MLGGILLLELPDAVFDAVVPALILLAVALMAFKPHPTQHAGAAEHDRRAWPRRSRPASTAATSAPPRGSSSSRSCGSRFPYDLQVLNAMKNVLAGVANAVAGLLFIVVADVAWDAALLIAGRLARRRRGRRPLRPEDPLGDAPARRHRLRRDRGLVLIIT